MERDRPSPAQGLVDLHERSSPVRRELVSRRERVIARLSELKNINADSNKVRLRAAKTHNSATAIAYRGEPFVNDFFSTNRELHDVIPTIKALYEQGKIAGTNPSLLEENDLFVHRFKGLSLMDIENMEVDPQTHELVPENIRKVNRMFRTSGIFRIGRERGQTYILEQLIYFASQQWIHPEIAVPRSLKKFQNNITAYFDYYTSFLTDFNRDPLNEDTMLKMLLMGTPYLPVAVSTYAPARLNITPSSAIKLYKQRELLAPDISSKFAWKILRKVSLRSFKQAYRNDAFPEDLEKYQHYSEETDRAAAMRLLSYMQETTTAEQQVQNKDEAENLLEQWNKHKKNVIREVMQNPKRRIEYKMSKNHPAEKVTVVRNRDTFVFIMHFSNDIHLTLEIDKTGRLFGVPPSLLKRYPHVSDTFIIDLLTPLLEKYKVKDVPSTSRQDTITQISTTSPESPIASDPETLAEVMQEEDQIIKPPKRKRLIPVLTIYESDPLPPVTPLAPKVQRFVARSEDQVKELLGPQVSRQQAVVDQVLRAIDNFEHGYIRGWRLRGEYGGITRIRAGDYRIFMDDLGNGNYSITQIVRRSGAYQPRA